MAQAVYRGVSNVARQVTKIYRGVSNVARQVTKGYRGVSNVARQFYASSVTQKHSHYFVTKGNADISYKWTFETPFSAKPTCSYSLSGDYTEHVNFRLGTPTTTYVYFYADADGANNSYSKFTVNITATGQV